MIYNKTKKIRHKKIIIAAVVFLFIYLSISIMNILIEPDGYFVPDYEKTDISAILEKNQLSEEDYRELFYQMVRIFPPHLFSYRSFPALAMVTVVFPEPAVERTRAVPLSKEDASICWLLSLTPFASFKNSK